MAASITADNIGKSQSRQDETMKYSVSLSPSYFVFLSNKIMMTSAGSGVIVFLYQTKWFLLENSRILCISSTTRWHTQLMPKLTDKNVWADTTV